MNCPNPIEVRSDEKKQIVPCGKCLVCLGNKRNDWSFRLMQEYKASDSSAFITLTYDNKYLPESGVSIRHFQLFMKRLRKRFSERLRYYAVGEYGTKTGRPHYHAIIFNFEGDEKFLRSVWPFGLVHIGKVNQASIMYVTKYVIQRGNYQGKQNKPFSLVSRGYGLGSNYLTSAMVKWHHGCKPYWKNPLQARNYVIVNGQKGRLPRFYKEKIWPCPVTRKRISNESAYQARKEVRKNVKMLKEMGYKPHKIIAEMRNAVLSRVKEKVAFTQSI